uniref:Uncharacterized protein n=1 Tax=Bracon brevicornis TaxID=1563983 RepID=A0A6V7L7I1_9HYME
MEVDDVIIIEEEDYSMEMDLKIESKSEESTYLGEFVRITPADTNEYIDITEDSSYDHMTNATVNSLPQTTCNCFTKNAEPPHKYFDDYADIDSSVQYHTCKVEGLLLTYYQEFQWTDEAVKVTNSIVTKCPPEQVLRFKNIRKSASMQWDKLSILYSRIQNLYMMGKQDEEMDQILRNYDSLTERLANLVEIINGDEWDPRTYGLPEL